MCWPHHRQLRTPFSGTSPHLLHVHPEIAHCSRPVFAEPALEVLHLVVHIANVHAQALRSAGAERATIALETAILNN